MKRNNLLAVFIIIILCACKGEFSQDNNSFTITGTVDDVSVGEIVSLHYIDDNITIQQDIDINNGLFEFKGDKDIECLATLTYGTNSYQLFLEPGKIEIDIKQGQDIYAIGTPSNDAYKEFMINLKKIEDDYSQIDSTELDAFLIDKELRAHKDSLDEIYYRLIKSTIADNINNQFGVYCLSNYYHCYDDPKELDEVLRAYPDNIVLNEIRHKNKNAYIINGAFDSVIKVDTVRLWIKEGEEYKLDKSGIITNGRFQFRGVADSVCSAIITVDEAFCNLYLEPGKIMADMKYGKESVARGTPSNDAYDDFIEKLKNIEDSTLSHQFDVKEKLIIDVVKNSVRDNIKNEFGRFCLKKYFICIDNPKELEVILDDYISTYPADTSLIEIKTLNSQAIETSEGAKYKDFEMTDMDGNIHHLSEHITNNKFTVLHFWRSNSVTLKNEVDAIKEMSDHFKDYGLSVIGIPLNTDMQECKDSLDCLGVNWLQLYDQQGSENIAVKSYGISILPTFILISQEGTILSRSRSDKDIREKIDELFLAQKNAEKYLKIIESNRKLLEQSLARFFNNVQHQQSRGQEQTVIFPEIKYDNNKVTFSEERGKPNVPAKSDYQPGINRKPEISRWDWEIGESTITVRSTERLNVASTFNPETGAAIKPKDPFTQHFSCDDDTKVVDGYMVLKTFSEEEIIKLPCKVRSSCSHSSYYIRQSAAVGDKESLEALREDPENHPASRSGDYLVSIKGTRLKKALDSSYNPYCFTHRTEISIDLQDVAKASNMSLDKLNMLLSTSYVQSIDMKVHMKEKNARPYELTKFERMALNTSFLQRYEPSARKPFGDATEVAIDLGRWDGTCIIYNPNE